jgi:hypothetical protein
MIFVIGDDYIDFDFDVKGKNYNNFILEIGAISPIDFFDVY